MAKGPEGYRAYAVGDVHGRADLLASLLDRIEADNRARGPAETVLVFLGDLIDRGADSATVLERLRGYAPEGLKPIFLAGNHEEVFLRVMEGEEALLDQWLRFGGGEFLASYGLDPALIEAMPRNDALAQLRAAVPAEHVAFVESFADTFRFGDYLFVHAGIRPGIALEQQDQAELRWIREPFLSDPRDHGFVVVHGHTIAEEIVELRNRIGIDTGAYRTGVLTALGVEGEERWFLQERGAATGQGYRAE